MSRLLSMVTFATIADGATVVLPHGLNLDQKGPITPDVVFASPANGMTVTADTINVTLTNNSGAVATVNVLCWHWHTFQRELGSQFTGDETALVPQPFVLSTGSVAGNNVFATANVNSDGTTNYTRNCTVARVGVGEYEITTPAIAITDCSVLVTLQYPGLIAVPISQAVYFAGGSTPTVKAVFIFTSAGAAVDQDFTVSILT